MKKKQLLGILLAGTMMVGAAVPVFAADGDRVKITYAQWGNETETAATQAVADKFNSEQDKIEVEVVKIDHDTYVTKLNAMATAGELPDTGKRNFAMHCHEGSTPVFLFFSIYHRGWLETTVSRDKICMEQPD